MTASEAPEILEYRYQQQILDTLEEVADHLPRLVRIGGPGAGTGDGAAGVDFLALAREMVGEHGTELFSEADMAAVRARLEEVSARIAEREPEIQALREAERPTVPGETDPTAAVADDTQDVSGVPAGDTAAARTEEGAE